MSRLIHNFSVDRYLLLLITVASIPSVGQAEFRSFDGTGNNVAHPDWGAFGNQLRTDGPGRLCRRCCAARLLGRPNPRSVGLALFRQLVSQPNASRLSGYVYAFGNFLSHDTQRTVGGSTEVVEFRIPVGDDIFAPNQRVPLPRSVFDPATGTAAR